MSADAASCLALAADAVTWARSYLDRSEAQKALNEIEYARTLCLKALKFEQEQVSARGTISAVESAGEIVPPPSVSPAANSSSLPVPQSQAAERPDPSPLAGSGHQFESDGPKSLPGDAAASLTHSSNSQRQERPSAQECSSDRSGGQFGDAPKPAQIQETRA
jgi:hypothetical protein